MFNRSVNKVVLVGNLGKDPEVRFMPNGNAVANFSLATTESWKNKQTGEYENQTEWHNLTVFGSLGKCVVNTLKKGQRSTLKEKLKQINGKIKQQAKIASLLKSSCLKFK